MHIDDLAMPPGVMLVGICGKTDNNTSAGAGKTTLARMLTRRLPGALLTHFADPIKMMAMQIGFTREQLYDEELKNQPHPFWDMTPRRFLQLLGTEMMRDQFDKDVWVKELVRSTHEREPMPRFVIVGDLRIGDEAVFVSKVKGRVIEVRRNIAGVCAEGVHATEARVPGYLVWRAVENYGTLEDLEKAADEVAAKLEEEYNERIR